MRSAAAPDAHTQFGLGIRLGYYIQWVATVLGAYYTPKMVSSAFEANTIFNIGMLAGLVYSTVARDDMHMIEPLIVLGFSVGGAIVGLLDPKNVHEANSVQSLKARMVHLCGAALLYLPLLVYWIWYAFSGMDDMSLETECPAWTFLFYQVDARAEWYRYLMKSSTVIAVIGVVALVGFSVHVYFVKSKRRTSVSHAHAHLPQPHFPHPHFRENKLSRTATAMALRARPTGIQFLIVIVACLVCGISVELSIIWNKIEGVNMLGATGQLIPMAIGLLTSARVLIGVYAKSHRKRKLVRRQVVDREMFGDGDCIQLRSRAVPHRSIQCVPPEKTDVVEVRAKEDTEWRDVEDWHDETSKAGSGKSARSVNGSRPGSSSKKTLRRVKSS